MKIEQQNQILGCMNDVLNQNGFRAEIMQKDGAPTILRCEAMRQGKVAKDAVFLADRPDYFLSALVMRFSLMRAFLPVRSRR